MADKINGYGTYHIVDNPSLYNPQMTNHFELIVTGLNGVVRAGIKKDTATENDKIKDAEDIIRLSVNKSAVPSFSQDIIEINRGNGTVKFAGKPSYSDISITTEDFIGADTYNALAAWQNMSYDVENQNISGQINYKLKCQLVEYSPSYEMVRYWDLYGCWISDLKKDDKTMDSAGKSNISATLTYDYFIPHLPDEERE